MKTLLILAIAAVTEIHLPTGDRVDVRHSDGYVRFCTRTEQKIGKGKVYRYDCGPWLNPAKGLPRS